MENINPIVLTDNETNEKYILEFTRETTKYAERNGFNIDDIDIKPMTTVPDLFFFAFRAHHRNITHDKSDKILFEDLGGLNEAIIERLVKLYYKPLEALINKEGNDEKNARMTVQL